MMVRQARQQAFPVRVLGPVAARLLISRPDGCVLAVFRSALYVGNGDRLVCLGTAGVEPGPLTLITSAQAETDWRACGLRPRQPVQLSAAEVRIGARFRFPLTGARVWSPPPITPVEPAAVARGLAGLRAAVAGSADAKGLGRFIDPGYLPGPQDHDTRAATGPISAARQWLRTELCDPAAASPAGADGWAGRLIGLGAGLTPAGDDFLGGMMIGLHATGNPALADHVWRAVACAAATGTNAISRAMLRAAAEGLGSDGLHRALVALLRSDPAAIQAGLAGLARIGHSSGWDAMAGAVTALECWLDSSKLGVA